MTDSSTLADKLADYAARALTKPHHSTQTAINGLVWAYQLMAERADPLDVLGLVRDTLDLAEPLSDLDLSGLCELRDRLARETRV